MRFRAVLTLPPRPQRDPDAAERDHDEGADDRERQQELEEGEAALIAPHRDGLPGKFGASAAVRRLTISTPRLSPQLTFTSIW